MFHSLRRARRNNKEPAIQVAPLIDLIFILLIFFLVTTSFVRETGLEVLRPTAVTASPVDQGSLLIGISASGDIYFEGAKIDLVSLRSTLKRRLAERTDKVVTLVVDQAASSGRLVEVMDECRLAGAQHVAIATRKKG